MTTYEIANRLQHLIDQMQSLLDAVEKKEAAESAPQIEPGTVTTLEDVRAVLTKVSGKHGAGTVKQLLAPHKKLSDVPHTEWAALIAKAEMIND